MADQTSWTSAIVALEGAPKFVTTQLRLLPSTPQILILPALSTYITTTLPSFLDVYDPVQHLRQVNAAMKRRHRDAQAFLRHSAADGPRLVFMDGGAASARALCLGALMQHETAGDRAAAEALLGRLTRRGLGGLAQAGHEQRAHSAPMVYSVRHLHDEDESSDPGTRAMRAADALDRQTASLQVSNELDLTTRHHSLSRAASLPVLSAAAAGLDTPGTSAEPFFVFGHSSSSSLYDCTPTTERPRPPAAQSPALAPPRFSVVHYDQHAELPSVFGFDDFPAASSWSSAEDGEITPRLRDSTITTTTTNTNTSAAVHRRFASNPISPMSDAFSMRSSVGNVEYGRASLLHMRRTTSVRGAGGDGFLGAAGVKAAIVGTTYDTTPKLLSRHATAETRRPEYNNALAATRQQFVVGQSMAPVLKETLLSSSSTGGGSMTYPLTRVPSTTTRPRTISVKRTRPVIKLQPVPSTKKRRWQQGKSTYIDDEADVVPAAPTPPPEDDADYEPVFPRMEDLVLFLRSELTPQPVLESALNAMREEYMRKSVTCCSSASSSSSSSSTPSSKARSSGSFKSLTDDGTAGLTSPEESCTELDDDQVTTPRTAVKMTEAMPSMDDYDPFAYINPAYGASTHSSKPSQASVAVVHPPTPAQTPPPEELVEADSTEVASMAAESQPADTEKEVIEELDCSIQEVVVEPKQPPVEVQNSIRDVLYRRYPVATKGYVSSFQFPAPPTANDDGLWRPLFRSRKTSSLPAVGVDGHLLPPTQLKQILAVGLQNGIKREYAARVISQIERFGTEPTGAARCTRLDFRYLLANTMQSFTSQPLRSQMAENPFGSPQLLAARLLPHLETYLAMHADIRFLILEYPPEHLATIIALQKLASVNLIKIAQIVDARSKERLPFRQVRAGSVSSGSGNSANSGGSSIYSRRTTSLTCNSLSVEASDANRAKANFLLTSSASGKDIADFVAAVWNVPVPDRPQTAPEAALPPAASAPPSLAASDDDERLPLESFPLELPATASPPTPETSPVQRKAKPPPLRVSALSAFPKPTGPQSPLTSSANMLSVLAPPATMTPPTSSKQEYHSSSRTPSPEQQQQQQQQQVVARVSAVGTSTLHLRRQLSNSTMRTTNSGMSAVSRASTPHIAYMRKNAPPAPSTPSRLYNPSIPPSPSIHHHQPQQQQHQQHQQQQYYHHHHHLSQLPPPPRFLDSLSSSMAGSTLLDDGASSIMTFDPAEDSDYDQEERRLMPFFGKKRRRVKPGTQKALRVLGMMA
ncbi:gastric mucin [Cordyceps militaris]|uniref:Gastric mucin n=1 Tax=Cordyceps militaris TaxID=73501 RepID=A0A2H4SCY0_CORMI|nr:gastric mucin [Cordyceps militaris]